MDLEKIQVVAKWTKPKTLKQLQWFSGLTNFYCHFVRDYSCVAVPLTKLTFPMTPFSWTPEADLTFAKLKTLFTSAPILVQPNPVC